MKNKLIFLSLIVLSYIVSEILITQTALPAILSVSSTYLDTLDPLDGNALAVYLGLFVTMISFLVASLFTVRRVYYVTVIASFLIAFLVTLGILISYSTIFVVGFTDMAAELEPIDIILRLHIMPVIVVIVFNNSAEFWSYSSLIMLIIYIITAMVMVKEK